MTATLTSRRSATTSPRCGSAPPGSNHPGGVNVAFADGSVHFVKSSVAPNTWWALGSRASARSLAPTRIDVQVRGRRTSPNRSPAFPSYIPQSHVYATRGVEMKRFACVVGRRRFPRVPGGRLRGYRRWGCGDHAVPRGNDDAPTRPRPGRRRPRTMSGGQKRPPRRPIPTARRTIVEAESFPPPSEIAKGAGSLGIGFRPPCVTSGSCRFGSRPLSSNPLLEPDNTGI